VTVNASDGVTTISHIWGNATGGAGAPLVTESTGVAGYDQTSFETFFGMDDAGNCGYSPLTNAIGGGTGLDATWVNLTPVATEGDPIPSLPGFVYRFNSRVGMTGSGDPYWVGGINTSGGVQAGNGLFVGAAQACLLKTGDPMPAPLASTVASAGVDFDVRMSANGTHYICNVTSTDPTASDTHTIIDGALALSSGSAMSEGTVVPVASGGNGTETWQNWGFLGINEAGDFLVTGDTNGAAATDAFLSKNGVIVHREGDVVDGLTLVGAPTQGAFMNESGEIAFIWDTTGSIETLFFEGVALLKEGDPVDWDGDGTIDAGTAVTDFTGISSLTTGTSGGATTTSILFIADVNIGGGTILEGFFRIAFDTPGVEYCFGDNLDPNVTTDCPCSNFGAAGNGCASSFNPSGAHITASGSVLADDVVLTGSGMQASGICVFLQGDAIDPAGFVFGDGVTCTGGALVRLRGVALSGGSASFPVPPETITLSQRGGVTVGSGAVRSYCVFYRNAAAAFCPPETFNVSSSYRITW
jgi:hypothetical protein